MEQLELKNFFDINYDPTYPLVQSNHLITARQDLTLTEAQIVRLAIMQILTDDMNFKPYSFSPRQFAKIVGCTPSNIYREAKNISDSIARKVVSIEQPDGSFVKYPWVSFCAYDKQTSCFQIQLNDRLSPFLLNLKERGNFTIYAYKSVTESSTIYSLRLWELLLEGIEGNINSLPKDGVFVTLTIKNIRDALMLYKRVKKKTYVDKNGKKVEVNKKTDIFEEDENGQMIPLFSILSHLKSRVIDVAVKDVNNSGDYQISYEDVKKPGSKKVTAFRFHIRYKINNVTEEWASENPERANEIKNKAERLWGRIASQ